MRTGRVYKNKSAASKPALWLLKSGNCTPSCPITETIFNGEATSSFLKKTDTEQAGIHEIRANSYRNPPSKGNNFETSDNQSLPLVSVSPSNRAQTIGNRILSEFVDTLLNLITCSHLRLKNVTKSDARPTRPHQRSKL